MGHNVPMTATALVDRVLLYDGDCGFCTVSATWLARDGRAAFRAEPWQALSSLEDAGLTSQMVEKAAFWLDGGRVAAEGADAIAAALMARNGPAALLGHLVSAPGIRVLARVGYRVVAKNRHRMPGATASCRVELSPERVAAVERGMGEVNVAAVNERPREVRRSSAYGRPDQSSRA